MNHIYKTVLNKRTGKLVVVSENSSSHVKSEQNQNTDHKKVAKSLGAYFGERDFLRKPLVLAISSLFSCMLTSMSYAETYTGTETLIASNSLAGEFNNFINDPVGIQKGIVVLNGNTPVESDSILTIDFESNDGNIPDFAVSGYSSIVFNSNSSLDLFKSVINNSLIFKKGTINGNIYSGLVQTFMLCNIDCSSKLNKNFSTNNSNNKIEVNGGFNIIGDLNSGINDFSIKADNLTGSSVYSFSEGQFVLNANNNFIEINGDNNIGNINSGISKLINITGDINASETALGFTTNTYFQAITNENNIIIDGENNFRDLNVGIIEFTKNTGKLTSPLSKVYQNGPYVSQANVKNNSIDINGKNNLDSDGYNINLGAIGSELKYGDLYSSNGGASIDRYDNNIFRNVIEGNNLRINGENNFKDIYLGNIDINIAFGEVGSITGNNSSNNLFYLKNDIVNNEIYVNGVNKIKSLNSGNLDFNFNSGEIFSTKTDNIFGLSIQNDYGESINISDNKIILRGQSEIDNSIKTGTINFDIDLGSINGLIDLPKIYINGLQPDRYEDNFINLNNTKAFAINNEITIEGSHKFNNKNGDSILSGGYLSHNQNQYTIATVDGGVGDKSYILPEKYDVFTGNTLNYYNINQKTKDHIDFKEIANFQHYNFTIDSELNSPDIPLLTAEKIVLGNDSSNMSDLSQKIASDIHVIEIEGEQAITNGTKYILMKAKDNLIANNNTEHLIETVVQQGLSRVYDVDTYVEGRNVVAVIEGGPEDGGVETNPKLESLLLGNLSGLMLLTRNGDLLSENLFNAISEQNHQRGLTPFIIMSGNHTKYETGRNSNIKSDGGLSTIGVSWQDEQTTLGAFVENGWDRYTTFNGFTEVKDVSGRGHNRFNGGGLYGHYDFKNGWYADATLRGGRLHTSFETDDLYNLATDERAHYKLKTNYYGANLAGGYVIQFDEKNSVNLNAKYLWAMTESKDLIIASEKFHFNKLDSHRLQFNIENLNQLNSEFTLISSVGYEHEFTGKAQGKAVSYGLFEIDDQHVKGGTGTSTLGVRYIPTQYKNLSMDIKATGYIGKRRGGMGMLKLDYKF